MASTSCTLQYLTPWALPQGIGDDAESVVSSSATIAESEAGYLPVFFEPRPLLNLQLVDQMPSLSPITDMKVSPALILAKDRIILPLSVDYRTIRLVGQMPSLSPNHRHEGQLLIRLFGKCQLVAAGMEVGGRGAVRVCGRRRQGCLPVRGEAVLVLELWPVRSLSFQSPILIQRSAAAWQACVASCLWTCSAVSAITAWLRPSQKQWCSHTGAHRHDMARFSIWSVWGYRRVLPVGFHPLSTPPFP